MTLHAHLELGTPLIWVNSDEPERVIEEVILQQKREVYRLDPFDGLVLWRDKKWVRVLVKNPEGAEGPCYDFNAALLHIYEAKGIFIIPNAHLMAKEGLPIFGGTYHRYREAFNENNADDLPFQMVLISATGEIPPEISRHAAVIHFDPSGPEELGKILADIKTETKAGGMDVLPDEKDGPRSIRSALGLTEAEFTQACLLSIKDKKVIDPAFINDFKVDKIKSGGVLEIRNPQIGLDDIGGLDKAKEIINLIAWTWANPKEAKEFDIVPIRRLLMIGVPGTGKSAICEAVASTLKLELAKFGVSSMMDKYIGESERKMRLAFKQIRAMAPMVIWGDELGRDLSGSGTSNDAGTTDRVHGEFLTGLQELPDNVIFMAAANRIDGIPPEMLRADRFDKIMFVGFPTLGERVDIFRIMLGDRAAEFDLQSLAASTDKFTGAEIKSLIAETRFMISGKERRAITNDDILAVAPTIKNRLWIKRRDEIIAMYSKALDEWDWASSAQEQEAHGIVHGIGGGGVGALQPAGNKVITGF